RAATARHRPEPRPTAARDPAAPPREQCGTTGTTAGYRCWTKRELCVRASAIALPRWYEPSFLVVLDGRDHEPRDPVEQCEPHQEREQDVSSPRVFSRLGHGRCGDEHKALQLSS